MRWSVPIGRISGITLRLHVTFLLFMLAIGWEQYDELGWAGAGWSMVLVGAIFVCIALHELGHSLVAQQLGVEVRSITLLPIGGIAALKQIPENPWHEIAITLAGPLVNAVIALLLLPICGLPSHLFLVAIPTSVAGLLVELLKVNVTLFFFNLIPAFPMDGGRLLRGTLALLMSYRRATTVATLVGQGIAMIFFMNGLGVIHILPGIASIWLLIIGVFIFFGAEGEERLVRRRSELAGFTVAELMSRQFAALHPTATIGEALPMVYQTSQDDFPVEADGRLVGLLSRAEIVEALNKTGPHVLVGDLMEIEYLTARLQEPVVRIHNEVLSEGWGSVPVLDDEDRVVGLLTPENINRFLLVQSSLKPERRPATPRGAAGHTPALPPVISTVPPVATPPTHAGRVPPPGLM
jgi:stage IV sporulation protein FB